MEAAPRNITSLKAEVATDMRVEEDGASADRIDSTEDSTKDISRETKNRRIVLNGDLLIIPKTSDYSNIVL